MPAQAWERLCYLQHDHIYGAWNPQTPEPVKCRCEFLHMSESQVEPLTLVLVETPQARYHLPELGRCALTSTGVDPRSPLLVHPAATPVGLSDHGSAGNQNPGQLRASVSGRRACVFRRVSRKCHQAPSSLLAPWHAGFYPAIVALAQACEHPPSCWVMRDSPKI